MTQKVLPVMRQQKSGRIITISSIAGFSGFPAMSAYVSTNLQSKVLLNPYDMKFLRLGFMHLL